MNEAKTKVFVAYVRDFYARSIVECADVPSAAEANKIAKDWRAEYKREDGFTVKVVDGEAFARIAKANDYEW